MAHYLAAVYLIDRLIRLVALAHFFTRKPPTMQAALPSVTLLQPITKGAADLPAALEGRANLRYSADIQYILVCDRQDLASQGICRAWIEEHPALQVRVILVDSEMGIASKTAKLQAGLLEAANEVVCCVDDDIMLRPDALRTMIPYLMGPNVGAVFGLACYTDWSNLPSGLMSAFVNSNALLTYVPGTYVTEPFTITGHIFAVHRDTLSAVGGFDNLENNIADDHILAEKIRSANLRVVQTAMIYDVENHFTTFAQYAAQMKRWFVFPRQALMPLMSPAEQAITLGLSVANFIPSILLVMAVIMRKRAALTALLNTLLAFNLTYLLTERLFLKRTTPVVRLPLPTIIALLSPVQIVGALLSDNEIEWRGRRLKIERGGGFSEGRPRTG